MSSPRADAIAEITLLPTAEGGRSGPTTPGSFACIVVAGGRNFDVRFDLSAVGRLVPGMTSTVPMRFLDPERARSAFRTGTPFDLREARLIGSGRVRKVSFNTAVAGTRRLTAAGE